MLPRRFLIFHSTEIEESPDYMLVPNWELCVMKGEFEKFSMALLHLGDIMDGAKEESGGNRVETSDSNRLNKINTVNIGIKDVDAMFEQACLDRDKDLDNLLSPYGESNNRYGFNNSALEFDSPKHNLHILEDPRSPYLTKQSSFFTSSPRPRPKPVTQEDMNTEILHLVDSAIMGQPESIDTMKNIVSGLENFGDAIDVESIADLLVDTLLTTMGGVESFEEDDDYNNIPTVMKNSQAAIISGEILPWLPWLTDSVGFMSPRTRLVRGLRTILRSCTRNRSMCCSAGLTRVLLQAAEKIFLDDADSKKQMKWNGAPLCSCLQYLAGHSVSVADLNTWFQLVKRTIKTPWGPRLMVSLERALAGKESQGPQASFEFDGESSGLLGPGEGRWPFPNGYAFATWIFIESFPDTLHTAANAAAIAADAESKSANTPFLFSFISSENQGIEAYFHAHFLVVESGSVKGRKGPIYFTHAFKPQCWYFIALEHTSNGEIRLYVDGILHETRSFDLPRITKPLLHFCIGTNPPPTMAGLRQNSRQCPLFAEMGPVYIFKETIGPEMIRRLASRGPDSIPSFGNAAGLLWLSTNTHVANIEEESSRLDADIAGYLHLLYHPSLLTGRNCPDASPSGPSGLLQRPGEVLGHVPVTTRMRPTEALWALAYGGPMSLLPFVVSKVDNDTLEPKKGNLKSCLASTALAAPIFRIISLAIQHVGNSNEICRRRGPEVLSKILTYLLKTLSSLDAEKHKVVDEEIVVAVVSLCQSQKNNSTLKVQLFSTLLLDLKIWSLCSYGIQKKLLSSLADMVSNESSVMRDAKAIQTLLDGCRRCYWIVHEKDSINTFSIEGGPRPVGEVNALVDELLVVIELLLVEAPLPMAVNDIRCLLGFLVDCPQPNQVARALHLIYRLVVQPNKSRATTFAEAFISCGGIETLLVLLQHEAKAADHDVPENDDDMLSKAESGPENYNNDDVVSLTGSEFSSYDLQSRNSVLAGMASSIGSRLSTSESLFLKNLGGIRFSISAENARNNVYNIDKSDGIVVAIIGLFGALVILGHLKFGSHAPPDLMDNLHGFLEGSGSMFDDKLNASARDEELNFYDPQHRFEHLELLLVLLRSLPYSTKNFQIRALQDILILACSHSENRSSITKMEEWPQWLLEILISNHEMGVTNASAYSSIRDVEDLIHSFLVIMLEHSLREKDGWKVLASMADDKGEISESTMERLTAAAAAEPYDSVSCAFVSYGSCVIDLAQGWKYRSRLWYGVGQPSNAVDFGGGGSGWDSWKSCLEKDSNGIWVEIPLIKKCVSLLQALLLDESGLSDGLSMSDSSDTGLGGLTSLYHLLDSDQPFLCMLRMSLLSLREDDDGENGMTMTNNTIVDDRLSERLHGEHGSATVLSPILHMPVSESKRQRVLVASCVLYSEVWHAVSQDRLLLRKQYIEAVVPPLVAVIRKWCPLLTKIHDLSPPDGLNPLAVDDPALDDESTPIESALAMITPAWAAAFASPPAAMALAMIAAGASGGEIAASTRAINVHLKRDSSTLLERKSAKLHASSSFQEPLKTSKNSAAALKDKAIARAAALAAARELERNAKVGSLRGLSAVAMATSVQRRSKSDMERVMRWNVSEAKSTAWMECLQSVDSKSVYGKDFNALSYKFVALLVGSLAFARNMQRSEVDRRAQVDFIARHRLCTGIRAWRKLIHYLIETDNLFGLWSKNLCDPKRVFWKIDYMESSSRMHRCLRRDFKGSDHSGVTAIGHDPMQLERDKENSILALKSLTAEVRNEYDEQDSVINTDFNTDEMWLYEDIQTRPSTTGEHQWQVPVDSNEPQVSNYQDLAQSPSAAGPAHNPSEQYEIIIFELPASMVQPLKVQHGTFQITTRRINFLVDKSEKNVEDKDRSWLMASLHQVHNRRYLLRRSALELFMLDRSNFFFDFKNVEARMSAHRAIVHARPPRLSNIYLTTQRPDQLLKRTQLMERWSHWEISNFEYLMQLNTLAGRSYNDITQYPIFPWILSDYKSTHLDLANPSSYRDLSKPIGALSDERLKKFQETYASLNDTFMPKYHYGSHYSTAGTVGGNFDRADQMFSDIGATWNGVLEDMNDVKELVPEMFYLSEILTNENSVDFGTTQLGDKLDSVRLPPWAENPVDFMHKHQMALESEYVSSHLHEWIDLIFGHAVQDQVAYFGQTPSRLLAIPHIKRMPLSDVLHMQTIFRNPKEVKQYHVPSADRCNLPASAIHATSNALVIVDTNSPSANIALHQWHPNTSDGHGMPFVFQPGKNNLNSSGDGGFMRMFRRKRRPDSEVFTYPQAHAYAASGIRSSSVVSITYNNEVITGGHVDNSIRLVSPDGAKTLEIAKGHCAPVTCLSLSPDSKYLVSGSRDTMVLVWRIHRSPRFRLGGMSEPPNGTITPTSVSATTAASCFLDKIRRRRIEGPIQVIRGHLGEIIDCCVDSDLGAVASCSYASDVLIHSVSRGRLLKKLHGVKADMVRLSRHGVVVMSNNAMSALMSYTLNGTLIARTHFPKSCSISCMEISFDGRFVLVGLNSCSDSDYDVELNEADEIERLDVTSPSVCLIDLHTLKVFHTMRLEKGQDITAMTLNKDNTNLVLSTSDKQLIIFTDPAVKFTKVIRRAGSGLIGLSRGTRQSKRSLASVSSDDD
ncbi:hypothetical protein L1987_73135 [Smallanthus sonchifolius]|uniref:Uncharacterized protein n=1 Tax=Smallanthus sonchifolius TaxID=185202 RepID=A0ACB9A0E3_9ASTR|nr:hypothetical protein L1987_73135 [Smallanthus sonchifolius]